ncbi:MAG: LON peptidase substrate-binding domain-containing protein, partial [Pseudomonadota bacterium]
GQDNHGRDAANDDEDPSVTTPHPDHGPALYDTGCMGRIIQFEETEDGRYIIMLEGLSRFRIEQELPLDPRGFRQVKTDWSAFKSDLDSLADDPSALLDRARLMPSLKQFFNLHGLSADWEAIERTPDDRLITTLCMICPFEPGEKQALLEAPDIAARADIMQALFDMAVHENDDAGGIRH